MNLNEARIPFVPRTASNCLDLAVMLVRRQFIAVLRLWLLITFPCCLCIFALSQQQEVSFLTIALIVFFVSSPLGIQLTAKATAQTLGQSARVRTPNKPAWRRSISLLMKGLLLRVAVLAGLFAGILPGIWIAVRTGFFVEKACLNGAAYGRHDSQTDQVLRAEFGDLVARACIIFAFCAALWVTLFFTLDVTMELLFGFPILMGRILKEAQSTSQQERMFDGGLIGEWITNDPVVLCAMMSTALGVYCIGRVAWFLCYLNVRVKADCWDIELQFAEQVQQLERFSLSGGRVNTVSRRDSGDTTTMTISTKS